MFSKRELLFGIGVGIAATLGPPAFAHSEKFNLDEKFAPQTVRHTGYKTGTIIIDPNNHFLYFQLSSGKARRYGIGVGRAGLAFKGQAKVGRKAKWPSWTPTANMIKRNPGKYARFAKGVPGGPSNPLGSRALYLYKDGRDTLYRIHGTTQPSSIGRSVSNGCIRMINEHVEDLFERVPVGAQVVVQ